VDVLNGSSDTTAEEPVGVILAQTDGVDLTTKLTGRDVDAAAILTEFFSHQVAVLAEFAAADQRDSKNCWRVIETSGDGIVFLVKVHRSYKSEIFARYIDALLMMHRRLSEQSMPIRSVSHYCDMSQIIEGSKINFRKMWDEHRSAHGKLQFDVEALSAEVFGYERIVIARLMAVAKGPFKILTQDFIGAMTDHTDMTDRRQNREEYIEGKIKDINDRSSFNIHPNPARVPVMKGLNGISLETPYRLWEISDSDAVS
jgi:hypothetical protein